MLAMSPSTSQHPPLTLINRLLWVSVALCVIIFTLSMLLLGYLSLWLSPASVALTMAFNITLLILASKERKRADSGHSSTTSATRYPAAYHAASVLSAWALAALWTASFGVLLYMIITITRTNETADWGWIPVGFVEIVMVALEIGIVVTTAVLCMGGRKGRVGGGVVMARRWYLMTESES